MNAMAQAAEPQQGHTDFIAAFTYGNVFEISGQVMRSTIFVVLILVGGAAMGWFRWFSGQPQADKSPDQARRPITDEQVERLVGEINRPIVEPFQNSPRGYFSEMTFEESDVSGRLRNIKWFSRCGKPFVAKVSMSVRLVSDWKEAEELCKADNWGNTELEAQNQLTIWLSRNASGDYRRWNDLVVQHKSSTISPVVDPAIRAFCKEHELDEAVVHSVQWDALGAMMENSYLDIGHNAFFFLELLAVYEAGHFPCGWEGEWPDGRLCVW